MDSQMELTVNEALQKAINAHKKGNAREADFFYTAILKNQPEHPDANHNLGVLCTELGEVNKAITFFEKAIKIKPNTYQFWLSYINALKKIEKLDRTKNFLKQAKQMGMQSDNLKKLEIHLESLKNNKALSSKKLDPSKDFLEPIMNLYKQQKFKQVIEQGKLLLKKFPHSAIINNILGASYASLDQLNKAIESYNTAIAANPNYFEAINNLGIAFKKQGKLEKAIKTFKKVLSIKPDYIEAYFNIANTLNSQGNFDEAIDVYRKVITLNPNHIDAYNNMGMTFKSQGKLLESIDSYKKALEIKPDYVEAIYNIGTSYLDIGWLEEAEDTFKKVILIKPNHTDAYNNLGATLKEQGKIKESLEAYKKELELDPKSPGTYYNIGFLLFENGEWRESLKYFENSIKLGDKDSLSSQKSNNILLKALYSLNEKDLFLKHLNNLVGIEKTNAVIGSFTSHANKKFGVKIKNLFCNNPMEYIYKKSLLKECNFEDLFINNIREFLNSDKISEREQLLLQNGTQTAGNIFIDNKYFYNDIKVIIRKEIDNYRHTFKNSDEGLIREWPKNFDIKGWLINMKSGGYLKSHIHENGWLSGSIYINVPKIKKHNSGNLVLSLYDEELESKNSNQNSKKIINIETGSLCLFPSSLYHYTIPFEADEERIVLAFDIEPRI